MSLKELPLPSIASLRAIAALKSANLAIVRPARIGLGFETAGANQKTLAEIEELLGGPGRLSLPYSLRWLLDVLTGLGVLHRTLSFVHGEVQPEHIVLGEDGVGRLLPVVRAHWVRGEERNPARLYYLAPEKLLGDKVDVRSDVFSVGVMLWEALAGQRLLEAYEVDDIIARLMAGGIPRLHAPEAEAWTAPLVAIAERAISVDPGRRFSTVAEMKAAIEGTCSRYLASPPGMAELFENPARRARSRGRDSLPPESQRATLPPVTQHHDAFAAFSIEPDEATALMPAKELADLTKFRGRSPLQEDVTKVMSAPPQVLTPAPLPVVRKGAHVKTLLGVPPPFVDRDSTAPEEPTQPRGITAPSPAVPPSPPPPVAFSPVAPSPPVPPSPPRPSSPPVPSSRRPAHAPLPAPATHVTLTLGSPPPPPEARHGMPLSPLIGNATVRPQTTAIEPSFELLRPRKRRGVLWLVLGAAAAIGLFAARPWLARQVAAATGALPDNGGTNADAAPNAAARLPAPNAAPSAASEREASQVPPPVGIASTPPAPSSSAPARSRSVAREQHVVIHDSVNPDLGEPLAPSPAPPQPEPVTAPPPTPAPPPAPAPTPKPKPVPVSDADRYGI